MRPATRFFRLCLALAMIGVSGCSASIAGSATATAISAAGQATPASTDAALSGATITLTARSIEMNPSSELMSTSIALITERLADVHAIVSSPAPGTLSIVAPESAQLEVTQAVTVSGRVSVRPVTGVGVVDPATPAPATPLPAQPPGSAQGDREQWLSTVVDQLSAGTVTCPVPDGESVVEDLSKPLLSCDQDRQSAYLMDLPILDVNDIESATSSLVDPQIWIVTITLTADGSANVGKQVAFTLDAEILTAPTIQSAITAPQVQISGNFSEASSKSVAAAIDDGGLPLHFVME